MVTGHRPIILIGGGGHAIVCLDLLQRQKRDVLGYLAPIPSLQMAGKIPFLGNDDRLGDYSPADVELVMGIGAVVGSTLRQDRFAAFKKRSYCFATLIHDSAIVASDAIIEEGAQIMAGSIVQASAVIGTNTIVNTKSSVDHECRIGAHVHVAPGATLCGGVVAGAGSYIGAGSTIVQGITVGEQCVIGAGAVVIQDVIPHAFVYGVPAKERTR